MKKLKIKKGLIALLSILGILIAATRLSISVSGNEREFVRPDLIPMIEQISDLYGISPELVEAVIEEESRGDSSAHNGSCTGLMQVSNKWHTSRSKSLGVDINTDYGNIMTGVDYLMELAGESDDLFLVLGTYNGQSDARGGVENDYAKRILSRANELEYVHGKRDYEYK